MSDLATVEQALLKADAAGDEASAQVLAAEVQRLRMLAQPSVMDVPRGVREEAARTSPFDAAVIGAGSIGRSLFGGIADIADSLNISKGAKARKASRDAQRPGEREAYGALEQKQPFGTFAGEVAATMGALNPWMMAAQGGLSEGTPLERGGNALAQFVGGKAGELGGKLFGRALGPKSMSPEQSVGQFGIPLTVGQRTQNPVAQMTESVLNWIPGATGVRKNATQATNQGFNRAAGESFGAKGMTKLEPEALGVERKGIGKTIGDIADRNVIQVDPVLQRDLYAVEDWARQNITDPNQLAGVLGKINNIYAKTITSGTGRDYLEGTIYKGLQSDLGEFGRLHGGVISKAMHDVRAAMRDAMTRSVSPADAAAWKEANKNYFNVQQVANAVKNARVPGQLEPAALRREVLKAQTDAKFGGGNDLADLAQFGMKHLPDRIPNSGTAQRLLYQGMIQHPGATAAGLVGAGGAGYAGADYLEDIPPGAAAGAAVPWAIARFLAGKPPSALTRKLLASIGAGTGAVTAQSAMADELRKREATE